MENGQTLNVVANDLYREIYFVLKDEPGGGDSMSASYLARAEQEIRGRLRSAGLRDTEYEGQMVEKQYVF